MEKLTLPDCAGNARSHASPCPRSGRMLCLYSPYSDSSAAKHSWVYHCFISISAPKQCKTTGLRKKNKIHLIRFSHHIHLDPRDLLNIVLPPGNIGARLLQSAAKSCQEEFTHVTVMLCKIKFSLTKSSCKWTTILVSDENLNDGIVCWVWF